jgi:hypothetical protein
MPNFIEGNGNIYLGFGQAQKYGRDKPIDIYPKQYQFIACIQVRLTTKQS